MENRPIGQTLCPDCRGTGKKDNGTSCPNCEGTGLVEVYPPTAERAVKEE